MNNWTIRGVFLSLVTLVALTGYAQDEKKIMLSGYVTDSFTKANVPQDSLRILVLGQDSTVVDTANVYGYSTYYGFNRTEYSATVPARPAKYIIKATQPDYETTYMDYEVKRVGRNRSFELPTLRMHRIQRTYDRDGGNIDEVVVTATKVKMVYKGDTIIFNADAFNVPEGSMLDALIKQLPGVELKEGGEIFVNGKKIDNLTLNGADFFKGKNKMMLENLPYYTVKNVQVYNKQTPKSKYLGRDVEQKEYTMDVVLKREYNVGGTAFVEAGYGTDKRYKAKGFGLRYSDHSRALLFGGVNNLNEYADVDRDGDDRTRVNALGDRDIRQLGGLWSLNASEERATNNLEYTFRWEDVHTESQRQAENYLSGASTFGQTSSTTDDRPFTMNIRNNFNLRKPFFLYSWIDFGYDHEHTDLKNSSLTARDVLFTDSINLSRNRSMSRSDRMNLNLSNQATVKMPWGDQLDLTMQASMVRTWNAHSFGQNGYTFYNTGITDLRNEFYDRPSKVFSISGSMAYRYMLTENLSIAPTFGIGYDYRRNDNQLYRLDWLGNEWNIGGSHAIGTLPADDLLPLALDRPNSSEDGSRLNSQSVGVVAHYTKEMEGRYIYLYGQLSEKFRRNHETYDNDVTHAVMNNNYHFPQLFVNFFYAFDYWHKQISFYGQNYSSTPAISQMVDITSTANPLNIRKGNPDLQPMTYWNFYANYNARRDSTDQHINIGLDVTIQHKAFANAYTYDPATGIYTSWTENVNGNWNLTGNINFSRALGQKKYWHFGTGLDASLNQSTDLSSGLTNRVTSTRLAFSPNLRFQKNKLSFTLKTDGAWQHIHRSINMSSLPTNVYDFSYGLNANYQLPWNVTINTDLTMHSRRGYADEEMNDNRLYWDATLTKSWKQGRWIAKLKGYDLLGQVSHWQYLVNSQGRYETWTNNMRRYVLFSLAYRFSITPKK